MLSEKPDKFATFRCEPWTLTLPCFIGEYELNDKLKALGSFLQNPPCLEKLTLEWCMVLTPLLCLVSCHVSYNLLRYLTRILYQFLPKAYIIFWFGVGGQKEEQHQKLMEVIDDHDHDRRLIELVWSLERRLPDVKHWTCQEGQLICAVLFSLQPLLRPFRGMTRACAFLLR